MNTEKPGTSYEREYVSEFEKNVGLEGLLCMHCRAESVAMICEEFNTRLGVMMIELGMISDEFSKRRILEKFEQIEQDIKEISRKFESFLICGNRKSFEGEYHDSSTIIRLLVACIRTNIKYIKGCIEKGNKSELKENLKRFENCFDMVNEILLTGQHKFKIVDLRLLIMKFEKDFEILKVGRNVEIEVDLREENSFVFITPWKITRVLYDMMKAVLEHEEWGQRNVRLDLKSHSDKPGFICLEINYLGNEEMLNGLTNFLNIDNCHICDIGNQRIIKFKDVMGFHGGIYELERYEDFLKVKIYLPEFSVKDVGLGFRESEVTAKLNAFQMRTKTAKGITELSEE